MLIGAAAALMLLALGRIAGVSGLAAATLRIAPAKGGWAEAAVFVVALPIGAAAAAAWVRTPDVAVTSSVPLLVAAGLLVGFGTRLGNGCTSGHGVCGMARLSIRSMAATATFMATGFATVFLVRHSLGAAA